MRIAKSLMSKKRFVRAGKNSGDFVLWDEPFWSLQVVLGSFLFTSDGEFHKWSAIWTIFIRTISVLISAIVCVLFVNLWAHKSTLFCLLVVARLLVSCIIELYHVTMVVKRRVEFKRILKILLRNRYRSSRIGRILQKCGVILRPLRALGLLYGIVYAVDAPEDRIALVYEIKSTISNLFEFTIVLQISVLLGKCRQMTTACTKSPLKCVKVHGDLVDLLRKLNWLYAPQSFLMVTASFSDLTSSLYFLKSDFDIVGGGMVGIYFFNDIVQVVCIFHMLCTLVGSFAMTATSVDAFYKELFRLMRESKTLCCNKKLCLYLSMRKTVNFTACGFFSLGYPLITSIIAAATTYLVILVQFSIPKN